MERDEWPQTGELSVPGDNQRGPGPQRASRPARRLADPHAVSPGAAARCCFALWRPGTRF